MRSSAAHASPYETLFRAPCRNALDAVWRLPANAEGVVRRACGAAEERRKQATRRSTRQAAGKSRVRRVPTTKAFKVGDPIWIRLPPAAQDNVAQKLLFQFVPGIVLGVSDVHPNTYEVRNIASGRELTRAVHDLHDRASRSDLLRRWDCNPFSHELGDFGADAVPAGKRVPAVLDIVEKQGAAPKVGMSVAIPMEFTFARSHPHMIEPVPLVVVGRVSAWNEQSSTARLTWPDNAKGEKTTASNHRLEPKRCLGVCRSAVGSGTIGDWAVYKGPSLKDGRLLASIVARATVRAHDGSLVSAFRCRQVGFGPDTDVWMHRDEMADKWPGDSDRFIDAYLKQCERLSNGDALGLPDESV